MALSNCCEKFKKAVEEILNKNLDSCFSEGTVAEENGRKFTIKKKKEGNICKVKIDGCVFKSSKHRKCDYLFKICTENLYLFVELKGKDYESAYEQITKTIDLLKNSINCTKENIFGFMVVSSVPSATNSGFRTKQEEFIRKYGKALTRKTDQCIYLYK